RGGLRQGIMTTPPPYNHYTSGDQQSPSPNTDNNQDGDKNGKLATSIG
ncbi:unnamed protein product, partial [marine sediment metagenome]